MSGKCSITTFFILISLASSLPNYPTYGNDASLNEAVAEEIVDDNPLPGFAGVDEDMVDDGITTIVDDNDLIEIGTDGLYDMIKKLIIGNGGSAVGLGPEPAGWDDVIGIGRGPNVWDFRK